MPRSGQRGLAGRGFGQQAAQLIAGGLQRGFRAFDGDQGFSQPVPDGLERGDRPTELDSVEGMLARPCQHGSAAADQPPAQCAPASGRGSPLGTRRIGSSPPNVVVAPSVRSQTTHDPPANGSGTVPPASRPAACSTTSLITGAWEPVSTSSRNTSGTAESGIWVSMSSQPSSANASSSCRPDAVVIVLRTASSSCQDSVSMLTPCPAPAVGAR